ncbi:MAG: helix-turn-helix domain-containing protein [Caldilineaceae bacterium]|nr:helix-turn-helix domain-containing protein [Caldilineaceae bacterium]
MQTVRNRILEILKQDGQASVGALAERLDMAPISVRYHLDILLSDNLITVTKAKGRRKVGRPQKIYALTADADAHFPDNFALLTAGVVRQMKQMLPPDKIDGCFRKLAQEMAQPVALDCPAGERLDERMDRVVAFLNERGYLAQWEPSTGLLHTHNCPYTGVAAEHKELCCMDLALMESLSGQRCERVQAIADGQSCCSFRVQVDIEDGAPKSHNVELIV